MYMINWLPTDKLTNSKQPWCKYLVKKKSLGQQAARLLNHLQYLVLYIEVVYDLVPEIAKFDLASNPTRAVNPEGKRTLWVSYRLLACNLWG